MKKKRAFTLIELLVIVCIIAILIACCVPLLAGGRREQRATGEEQMRTYLATLYPGYEIVGTSCTDRDTDSDGYISCSATIKDKNGQIIRENAECATQGAFSLNTGCKIPTDTPVTVK